MMTTQRPRYTPTQQRMVDVLSDGQPHRREELHACLVDELGAVENIRVHLSALRAKLRPLGEDILCEYRGHQFYYRHVRLIASNRS